MAADPHSRPHTTILVAIAALFAAFVAGLICARMISAATAGDEVAMTAQVVHVPALEGTDLGAPLPGAVLRYAKVYAVTKTASVQVQTGDTLKHFHADSNEIQYVVEGTGTTWLGDKQVPIGPGDLIFIPRGTIHGGTHAAAGTFKVIGIKTPPQAEDDYHLIP